MLYVNIMILTLAFLAHLVECKKKKKLSINFLTLHIRFLIQCIYKFHNYLLTLDPGGVYLVY